QGHASRPPGPCPPVWKAPVTNIPRRECGFFRRKSWFTLMVNRQNRLRKYLINYVILPETQILAASEGFAMHQHASDICRALRDWRIHARLGQAEIAECLGVTQSQVSRWESGRDLPRPHNVDAIRRLIWGADADPLQALTHFVEQSSQHLLLI